MVNDDIYKSGTLCTLNSLYDLFFRAEAQPFIGEPCVIVKRTKSGLIQVALVAKPKMTFSAPQANVSTSKCNCGALTNPHLCPYQENQNNNEFRCSCCWDCMQICVMDI